MCPNFNQELKTVPPSAGDDLCFKWSNKLGTYDTSSFSEIRAQGRLSREEIEELNLMLKGVEICCFNSYCQDASLFACCFFLGIPELVSIILATLGRIEAVLILSWMCICVFGWAFTAPYMDLFAYLFLKCRAKRVKRVFEQEWWTGDRIKRVKVETGDLGEYIMVHLKPLDEIDPQNLFVPVVGQMNAAGALVNQLGPGDIQEMNIVNPASIVINEDLDESQQNWVPHPVNFGQP